MSQSKEETHNSLKPQPDISQNDLPEISLTALALGLCLGMLLTNITRFKFIGLPLNLIFLCVFHFLEFYITAKYNPTQVTTNSYILRNGNEYTIATLFSLSECILKTYFIKTEISKRLQVVMVIGFLMATVGQICRTLAMITCGRSFNHVVQNTKSDSHVLVTSGIYKISRHPSYFGFFYWSIGCQLLCLNFVSCLVFAAVLWKFFKDRIQIEEKYLVTFFGQDYRVFKQKVGVGIPFIS